MLSFLSRPFGRTALSGSRFIDIRYVKAFHLEVLDLVPVDCGNHALLHDSLRIYQLDCA